MKTRIKIQPASMVIAALLILTSCADFLKEEPRSEFAGEGNYFYTDGPTLYSGVVGAYAKLRDLYVVATNTPLFMTLLGTDEIMYNGVNNVRYAVDRYTFTPTDGCIREYWRQYYEVVARTNAIITQGRGITNITEADRTLYLSNAKFLRAWAYFHLVQAYGALPLIKEQMTEFDYTVPRSPVGDVYDFIIRDLEECSAEGALPTEIKDGLANQWAAKALLGKVYLTMASAKEANKVDGISNLKLSSAQLYEKALTVLRDVKDNSGRELLPVYGDVFKIANKNTNKESLWEIQFSSIVPYGSQWSKEMGAIASGYDSQNLAGGWRSNGLAGNANLKYVPSFRNYYNADGYDTRRAWNLADSIVLFNKATNLPTGLRAIDKTSSRPPLGDITNKNTVSFSGITKYRWGDSWQSQSDFVYSNCPNNIISLRFADVLLMFAEADLGANGTISSEGLEAINRVVKRARGVGVTAEDTPTFRDYTEADITIDEILYERARELCFEYWRWFDLARTGKLEQFLEERDLTPGSQAKTEFKADRHYVFPIPLTEIQTSTNKEGMYQNPNYTKQ